MSGTAWTRSACSLLLISIQILSESITVNTLTHLNRRRFLQGTGIALSLPAFESLAAGAATNDESPRRLVCVGNHLGFYPGNFFPKAAGKDYVPTSTLNPLETHRDDLTVFSHLDHGLNGGHKAVQGFLTSIKKEEADWVS